MRAASLAASCRCNGRCWEGTGDDDALKGEFWEELVFVVIIFVVFVII